MTIQADTEVLKESVRGIRAEINARTRQICNLLQNYRGSDDRFRLYGQKPPHDKTNIELTCLSLRREIIKLKVIKAELNLIISLKELQHA